MNPNADRPPVSNMHAPGNFNKAPDAGVVSGRNPESLSQAESLMPPGAMQPQPQMPPLPNPIPMALPAHQLVPGQQTQPVAASAKTNDDDDMALEKESVNKAKAIIQQTSTDPFRQAKEIEKVKAELLKRRYGKELKLSEG